MVLKILSLRTLLCGIISLLILPALTYAQDGEALFLQNCTACHTIDGGPLVGPDLKDVHTRYQEDWLMNFIRSSQSMVQDGDEQAVAIFQEFNMIPMPDQPFNNEQISTILAYIKAESEEVILEPVAATATTEEATIVEVVKDQNETISWLQGDMHLIIIILGLEFTLVVLLISIIFVIVIMKRRM